MTHLRTHIFIVALTLIWACGGGADPTGDSGPTDADPGTDGQILDIPDTPGDLDSEDLDGDFGQEAGDAGDSVDPGDVAKDEGSPTWITPEACENSGEAGEDPLTLLHQVDVTEHPLGHFLSQMVDLERDPEHDRIYAVGWGGFYVFNEFDWGIQLAGRHNGQGGGLGLFYRLEVLEESVVAATHRDYGLAFLPAEDPSNLYMSWVFNIGSGSGMAQVDDYLHVVTHTGDLHTFDVSTPNIPEKLGKISGLSNAWDIVVKGNKGYVADNTMGVVLVDFSDPAWPVIAESFQAVAGVQDLSIQYDTLYVAVGSKGVQMFDISVPSEPTSKGLIPYPKPVISVSTAGKFLWGATYDDVFVIDILGGFEPIPLAHRRTDQWAMHVDAIGTKAYVANWGKLEVYQIDAAVSGPDLLLDQDILFFWSKPDQVELKITNMGTAELHIYGAEVDDPRFSLVLEQALVPAGESRILRILFDANAAPVHSSLCLSTNDADTPHVAIPLRSALDNVGVVLGSDAPDFTLTDSGGQPRTLSNQLGKPVVLSFFSPSDPRAPSHFSDLQASIRASYPEEEVVVWGIGPSGMLSTINKFRDDMGLTFPILHDVQGLVQADYAQPEVFLGAIYPNDWIISKEGKVIYTSNTYIPTQIKTILDSEIAK